MRKDGVFRLGLHTNAFAIVSDSVVLSSFLITITYQLAMAFSLNAEGSSFGISLTIMGRSKDPPGGRNKVSEGTVLQISKYWSLTFCFSFLLRSRTVDKVNSLTSSPL